MASLILSGSTSGSVTLSSPAVSGTTTLTLPATTGTVLITNGSGIASVNGIQFPATQSASADANTLDDYEEGTWTPVLKGGTTAGTGTYTSQVGVYTKVGKVVYYEIELNWSSHTGTGTYMSIDGFPFASAASPSRLPVMIRPNNIALSALNIITASMYTGASTFIVPEQMPTGGGATADVAMDTAGGLLLSGFYFV
jgi:hypothetical protein